MPVDGTEIDRLARQVVSSIAATHTSDGERPRWFATARHVLRRAAALVDEAERTDG